MASETTRSDRKLIQTSTPDCNKVFERLLYPHFTDNIGSGVYTYGYKYTRQTSQSVLLYLFVGSGRGLLGKQGRPKNSPDTCTAAARTKYSTANRIIQNFYSSLVGITVTSLEQERR